MKYDELVHCIRAVSQATGEADLYIFGSQSALLHFGDNLPYDACESRETDIMTSNNSIENAYIIAGNFGEDTMFNQTFDLEVDGVLAKDIILPPGWEARATIYEIPCYDWTASVVTPDVNDIAVAKLVAKRDKDRKWLQAMYDADAIHLMTVLTRLYSLRLPMEQQQFYEGLLNRIEQHDESSWEPRRS